MPKLEQQAQDCHHSDSLAFIRRHPISETSFYVMLSKDVRALFWDFFRYDDRVNYNLWFMGTITPSDLP